MPSKDITKSPQFWERIQSNNERMSIPRKILVIYDNAPYIGDAYLFYKDFVRLNILADQITIACSKFESFKVLQQISENHPIQSKIQFISYTQYEFNPFDSVLIIEDSNSDESSVLNFIESQFQEPDQIDHLHFSLFYLCYSRKAEQHGFLQFKHFEAATKLYELEEKVDEVIIHPDEMNWCKEWLRDQQLADQERVIIFLSGSSAFEKMISREVYFEMLLWFLEHDGVKVLVFDENKVGKKHYIEEEIGSKKIKNVIIAEGFSIRESMRIMASEHIEAIIGPCTGLMHLADGVYKYLIRKHLRDENSIPLLLTYVGLNHDSNYNPFSWWSESIVNCYAAKRNAKGEKVLVPLEECEKDTKKFQETCLRTNEITSKMLIDLISEN